MTTLRPPELGPLAIQATIDKIPNTITEDLVRSRLQLANDGGIDDLPTAEIYYGMDNLGTKSGSWGQFGSTIAVALICLSDGRRFNWSNNIFKGIVSNIGNAKKFLTKLFANMRLNFEGHPMPLLPAMLLQAQAGKGAEVAAQAVPPHMPAPDQPHDHLSTPSRQQTSGPKALVFEFSQCSNPYTASFDKTDVVPFTNVEDEPLGGSFHMSPPRSTQVPPEGQPSGGAKDPTTQTALSFIVSTLVQKVKSLEVKLETKKRTVLDVVPTGPSDVPTSASVVPTHSPSVPAVVPTDSPTAPTGVSNKGKAPMVDEDILVKARSFKRIKDDRLGEEAAKRLHDEEHCQLDRQQAELQRRRQQEVLDLTLLGDDVSEDNFPAKMAALIKRKRQALAEKLAQERQNRPMIQAQQRTYMRQFRTGPVLVEPSSKRQKSTEAPLPSVPEVPQSLVVSSHTSSGTRRKFLVRLRLTKPKSTLQDLDLDADAQTFIKIASTEDSDNEAPSVWSTLVGWEVIPTPLGDINALYRIDQSTKHVTILRQILHMVDRQDLVKLYGLVVQYYETHHVAGAGLLL
nr:JmjC domain-containing protein [Tanacetum cinerariifolium]